MCPGVEGEGRLVANDRQESEGSFLHELNHRRISRFRSGGLSGAPTDSDSRWGSQDRTQFLALPDGHGLSACNLRKVELDIRRNEVLE